MKDHAQAAADVPHVIETPFESETMQLGCVLEALGKITRSVVSSASTDEKIAMHVSEVQRALGVDACVVRQLRGANLELVANVGVPNEIIPQSIPAVIGLAARVILDRKAFAVPSISDSLYSHLTGTATYMFQAYAGAPMVVADEVVGLVGVFMKDRPRDFSPEELALLQIVADHMGVVLQNADLYQRLTDANAELDQRVQERTAELENATKDLEGFTYMVAHDLRAPLRAISMSSTILLNDFAAELSEGAAHEIRRQIAATRKLSHLIDDLLALARIGRSELKLEKFSLTDLAESVMSDLRMREWPYDIECAIQRSMHVVADPSLVRMLLQNLLENAVKFADPARGAKIEVTYRDHTCCVRDHGIGFEPQYAEKVFEPFERLVRERDFPGTGIGLANVRRVASRHGGTAWVEPVLGKGCAFYFTLGQERQARRARQISPVG